jgi:hypothetical protein
MTKVPVFIKDAVKENESVGEAARTDRESLRVYGAGRIDVSRDTLNEVLKAGYAVAGISERQSCIEVWFEDVSEQMETQNLAERAAVILRRGSSARFEPSDSDEPMKQYVDVYPDPYEVSSEDYSLKDGTLEELRDNGIELRSFSGGRERSDFNDENYRLWFTKRDRASGDGENDITYSTVE